MGLKSKNRIAAFFGAVFYFFYALSYSFAAAFTGEINSPAINVRVDSTTSSEVICVLDKKDKVDVASESYGWYKIRLPKKAPSYVKANLTECIKTEEANLAPDKPVQVNPPRCINARIIKERVNIRLKPNESSWILGKAGKNTIINLTGEEGPWYKIEPIEESFGWINKKFVDKIEPEPPEQAVQNNPAIVSQPVVISGDQLIIEGKVEPYGMVLWRKATHKIVTADNRVYLLMGNKSALNALCYNKVKISGKIINPQAKFPLVEIEKLEAEK